MYLRYAISGGEFKIGPVKMESIMLWTIPTNAIKVRIFVGATKYLNNLTTSFLTIATPLHAITTSGKSFQWGKNQHKYFDELKNKISQVPVLALPNLQKPFEVKSYKWVCYASGVEARREDDMLRF